jgi:hypothetical protein
MNTTKTIDIYKGENAMKKNIVLTFVALFSLLLTVSSKAFAAEPQPGDDRGRSLNRFSSHFFMKNGLSLTDDRGGSLRGMDDRISEDRSELRHGADDPIGDDRGGLRLGSDDPAGDDKGGLRIGSDDPAGDDKGGLNPGASATPSSTNPAQPVDDKGGHGHGGDDPAGHK